MPGFLTFSVFFWSWWPLCTLHKDVTGKRKRYMPLALSIFGPVSFFITYAFAVGNDHVSAFWPYISDTGTLPPESCIFGLLLNIFGFSLLPVVYVRYKVIGEVIKRRPSLGIKRTWNRFAACLGYVSCFGLVVVANFEETNQILIHITGAIMAFVCGIGYSGLQTNFSYKMDPNSKTIYRLRIFLTTFCLLCVIGFLAPIAPAMAEFKGTNYLKWTPESGGYYFHIASTISEWFLMFSYSAFFVTIFLDFRKVKILPLQIQFIDAEEESNSKSIDQGELNVVIIGNGDEERSAEFRESISPEGRERWPFSSGSVSGSTGS